MIPLSIFCKIPLKQKWILKIKPAMLQSLFELIMGQNCNLMAEHTWLQKGYEKY